MASRITCPNYPVCVGKPECLGPALITVRAVKDGEVWERPIATLGPTCPRGVLTHEGLEVFAVEKTKVDLPEIADMRRARSLGMASIQASIAPIDGRAFTTITCPTQELPS
jgi:hypothetical protein